MTDRDPLALEEQVCFALAVASRSVIALYRPLLEPMGLTHPQYLVMLALWEDSPLTVKRLSDLLQLDPGTLSPLLKRLESAGYLHRHRDPHDERALAVTLTDTGRTWWLWTCMAGLGLGLFGIDHCRRRRRARQQR